MCTAVGALTEGQICTVDTDCARGFDCAGSAGYRACRRYCGVDTDCVGPGSTCQYVLSDLSNGPVLFATC